MRERIERELDVRGLGRIVHVDPTGGGCISETRRLLLSGGARVFLKWWQGGSVVGLFAAEARSLSQLGATRTLRVPEVIALADDADSAEPRWLLLEWLEPGRPDAATWERLGERLAALHHVQDARFGGPADNFIGTLPQSNAPSASWSAFWETRRLRPQLELALAAGAFGAADIARFDALFAELPDLLEPGQRDGPSLLHGDLWSGNLHVLHSGEPALVDPSSYFGHREVDLAMTELFGGFHARFLDAYRQVWPLADGYDRERRPVYQLYYLLVHVNLFGLSYRRATLEALGAAGF